VASAAPPFNQLKNNYMLWALISFLVALFILAIIIYVVKLVLDMIPLPSPAKTIAYLILGLLAFVFLLSLFTGIHLNGCVSLFCR